MDIRNDSQKTLQRYDFFFKYANLFSYFFKNLVIWKKSSNFAGCFEFVAYVFRLDKSAESKRINRIRIVDTNVAEDVAYELTENQKNILSLLKRNVAVNVAINTAFLAEQMRVNRKTIQREMSGLMKAELVKWVGSAKTGYWISCET